MSGTMTLGDTTCGRQWLTRRLALAFVLELGHFCLFPNSVHIV